jgi:hypothetical protein
MVYGSMEHKCSRIALETFMEWRALVQESITHGWSSGNKWNTNEIGYKSI